MSIVGGCISEGRRIAKFPTIEEFVKIVAEEAINNYEYEGKTIREWIELILKQKENNNAED